MKHMKKSMFITTLAMVVVLVVALSTATFAWYTANTQTGVTTTNVTSASSSTASLVVDSQVAGQNDTNNSVTLTLTGTAGNVPMVYTSDSAPEVGTTSYEAFIGSFKTFTRDAGGHFASEVSSASPARIAANGVARTDSSGTTSEVIVLTNVGGSAISTVKTTITLDPYYIYTVVTPITVGTTNVSGKYELVNEEYVVTQDSTAVADKTYYTRGNARNTLRVAVFACPTNVVTGEGDYTLDKQLKLKGIFGDGTSQRASATGLGGAITVGTTNIATTVGNATLNTDLDANFLASEGELTIATAVPAFGTAGNSIYVKVVAWFEGGEMANADSSKVAAFTMAFNA